MKSSHAFLLVWCAAMSVACNKTGESTHESFISGSATFDEKMPDLARKNRCAYCHAIDRRMVGPSWMDVSRKYRGDPSAEARLIVKVSRGGAGVWGSTPMPANDESGNKQDQIRELVRFILKLAAKPAAKQQ